MQSQAFNTGAAVPWARPGVGVVATQSFTDRRYGYRGLELLAAGRSPADALAELVGPTTCRRSGRSPCSTQAARSRSTPVPTASPTPVTSTARTGRRGNMLAADAWHAMGAAFEAAEGSLAQRLMTALDTAEAEGGDWRGRGGAAIVVVPAEGEPWERVVDLRVEEGDSSLVELRRLLERAEGYRAANRARPAAPVAAAAGLPEQWVGWLAVVDAASAGDLDEARRLLDELAAERPLYRQLVRSLAHHPELRVLAPLADDLPPV